MIASDSLAMGRTVSNYLIVDNPENYADPEIILLHPLTDSLLTGDVEILWRGGDADGDSCWVNIHYSTDGGNGWQILAEEIETNSSYLWNTTSFPNGISYRLKLSITDGIVENESKTSSVFELWNEFSSLPDSMVVHLQGGGNGLLSVSVVDPSSTTGHIYEVTFNDTSKDYTTYDVFDLDAGVFVVEDCEQLSWELAGPEFGGLRLVINDIEEITIDESGTGWSQGNCNLIVNIFPSYNYANLIPVDYQIHFYDEIVDTSVIGNEQPINFLTWNVTDSVIVDVVFYDNDENGIVSAGDIIIPVNYSDGEPNPTWRLEFENPDTGSVVLPENGDVFSLITNKPFSYRDSFEIISPPMGIQSSLPGKIPETFVLEQNYPNPFNPLTEIVVKLPVLSEVEITIFDLLGREVRHLISQELVMGKHQILWNGKDNDGKLVASGIYLCIVKAKAVNGDKPFFSAIKMALLK